MLPPYGEREGWTARKGGAGEWSPQGEEEGAVWQWVGGNLKAKGVASERRKKCRLCRCRGCVDSSLAVLRGQITSGSHQMWRCRMPALWFELQIFRLQGKGGYSTRTPGTTNSLLICWDLCCIRHKLPPTEGEKGQQLGKEGQEKRLCRER